MKNTENKNSEEIQELNYKLKMKALIIWSLEKLTNEELDKVYKYMRTKLTAGV